jgi:hypothetical protein
MLELLHSTIVMTLLERQPELGLTSILDYADTMCDKLLTVIPHISSGEQCMGVGHNIAQDYNKVIKMVGVHHVKEC